MENKEEQNKEEKEKKTDNSSDDQFEPEFKLEDSDIEFGKCPMCKVETFDLEPVDDFTKSALEESNIELIYDSVCVDCFLELKENISQVGRLRAAQKKRLQELLNKWTTKFDVLKTGRTLMSQKIYSEAQKCFEEYITILEAVYNKGQEGLTPKMIPAEHRRQEATLICSLYCDLIYIYDQYEPGTAKLKNMCDSLITFLPFSRGQGRILRKIKKLQATSKNEDLFKNLFSVAKNKKNSCFIATAVFSDQDAVELSILRNFRDHTLKKFYFGRLFIKYYYRYSPPVAEKIKQSALVKKIIKYLLIMFSYLIDPLI